VIVERDGIFGISEEQRITSALSQTLASQIADPMSPYDQEADIVETADIIGA
jgi:hypothetical protein